MPMDPQARQVVDNMAKLPPLEESSVEDARERSKFFATLAPPGEKVAQVEDRELFDGVKVRIYTPAGDGPFPCFLYYHGGGWVIGDLDSSDSQCRRLANLSGSVVISADYRRAPEHKFPTPAEDCYRVLQHVLAQAARFNIDADRVAVGGDSAGGNLAAAVCLLARDRGGKLPRFQLLIYPVTDHRYDTKSYDAFATDHGLARAGMQWFWNHYLERAEDGASPYASCLRADVKGLPPALVVTAEFDVLRDEGEAYARKLQEAGVRAEVKRYDGMIHGFFNMDAVVDVSKRMIDETAALLKKELAG